MARKKAAPSPTLEEVVAEEAEAPAKAAVRNAETLKALAAVAARFAGWRPARDVLSSVEAVPTIFPWFDWASGVGGLPKARVALVHGPSSHGKTTFANGMGLSFLEADSFFGLVDAENTTPIEWLEKQMGAHADHPGFFAIRPHSYEEIVDAVRRFLTGIGDAREKGQVPKETSGVVVVDSVRKLVPKNILAKLLKEGAEEGSVDGMGGRGAQIKAALNAAWLDEVTLLLHQTNTSMVLIARESEDVNASAQDRKYGKDFKVTGGKALVYDSSLVIRVTRNWNYQGSGDDKEVVGERHEGRIWKTKVGAMHDRYTDFFFSTSNGKVSPEGFDRARDVVELADVLGITKTSGSWISWPGGGARWQGTSAAVRKLSANRDQLAALEAEVRAKFREEAAPDAEEVLR